ncbi:MAG: sensor histidine kinase [Burkholderiaceae bacterium]|nr:sensor histidine kinase [Burkholderiaceae bacterium]
MAAVSLAAVAAFALTDNFTDYAARWRRLMPLSVVLPLVACVLLATVGGAALWTTLDGIRGAVERHERTWRAHETVRDIELALTRLDTTAESASSAGAGLTTLVTRLADLRVEPTAVARVREVVEHRINTGALQAEDATTLAEVQAALQDETTAGHSRIVARCRFAAALAAAAGLLSALLLGVMGVQGARNVQRRRLAESEMQAAHDTLEAKVALRTAQLSHLSRHLLQLAETEKTALANELHDELGSNLTAINLDISSVAARLAERDPTLAERLNRTLLLLRETVDIKRRIIQGLRPSIIDNLGLSAAIHMHCEEFERRNGLPCRVDCAEDFPEVEPATAIALFRVAQEALNNISKYAGASQVHIHLSHDEAGITLRVVDDGVGIDLAAGDKPLSHGLLGMRERMAQLDGRCEVRRGEAGRGTVVEVFVPRRAP